MKNCIVIVSKHCMCLDSRAMGDFSFKQNANLSPEDQIVSGCPDVVCRSVSQDWQFVLLACDGIWDVLSNQVIFLWPASKLRIIAVNYFLCF